MNKVYMSGIILDDPMMKTEKDGSAHLVFHLGQRYRMKNGEYRKESYRVSGWNRIAEWGSTHLGRLQPVCVLGHLTQKTWLGEEQRRTETEIVAEEILLCQRWTKSRANENATMDNAAAADGLVASMSTDNAALDGLVESTSADNPAAADGLVEEVSA